MTVDNMTPFVGGDVVFTIEITNNGPSDATGIEVADLLPSGYSYVSDDTGTYDAGTGIWTIGAITSGNTSVINITATVNATGTYSTRPNTFGLMNTLSMVGNISYSIHRPINLNWQHNFNFGGYIFIFLIM